MRTNDLDQFDAIRFLQNFRSLKFRRLRLAGNLGCCCLCKAAQKSSLIILLSLFNHPAKVEFRFEDVHIVRTTTRLCMATFASFLTFAFAFALALALALALFIGRNSLVR